jgi:hypothetical protein
MLSDDDLAQSMAALVRSLASRIQRMVHRSLDQVGVRHDAVASGCRRPVRAAHFPDGGRCVVCGARVTFAAARLVAPSASSRAAKSMGLVSRDEVDVAFGGKKTGGGVPRQHAWRTTEMRSSRCSGLRKSRREPICAPSVCAVITTTAIEVSELSLLKCS